MNKKDFYLLFGRIQAGYTPSNEEALNLLGFIENLLELIEETAGEELDIFGTEGWESAIGWY